MQGVKNKKKKKIFKYKYAFDIAAAAAVMLLLTGCGNKNNEKNQDIRMENQEEKIENVNSTETSFVTVYDELSDDTFKDEQTEIDDRKDEQLESFTADKDGGDPQIVENDWSDYFQGCEGTAVLYYPSKEQIFVYQKELAEKQSSPCSTFKIISSLIALENGILDPENATRKWSGEQFWNQDWNQDIDFYEAFRTSCVWYFRELVNEIGQEQMQKALAALSYGNCDITDWEGRLNTNNNNRALTGFWIESSLKISPREQVQVMEYIFGDNSPYSPYTLKTLKKAMLTTGFQEGEITIYGKTGMGKVQGIVVDAWYTGFAEYGNETIYFCVHLSESGKAKNAESEHEISSAFAKEIAIAILQRSEKSLAEL